MKLSALFLFFARLVFSAESENLVRAKKILDSADSYSEKLNLSINLLDEALAADNIGDIYHKILIVDKYYGKIVRLREEADDLILQINKRENISSKTYSEEMSQADELKCFLNISKKSLDSVMERMKIVDRKYKEIKKKNHGLGGKLGLFFGKNTGRKTFLPSAESIYGTISLVAKLAAKHYCLRQNVIAARFPWCGNRLTLLFI